MTPDVYHSPALDRVCLHDPDDDARVLDRRLFGARERRKRWLATEINEAIRASRMARLLALAERELPTEWVTLPDEDYADAIARYDQGVQRLRRRSQRRASG